MGGKLGVYTDGTNIYVILGISIRQVKRLCRAEHEQGATGLISKRRGQAASNRISDAIKQQVIVLARNKYVDFGPTFMSEKLRELDGIELGKEAIRQILMSANLWQGKKTKRNLCTKDENAVHVSVN